MNREIKFRGKSLVNIGQKTIQEGDWVYGGITFDTEEIDKNTGGTCPLNDYNYDLNCENECKDDYKKCWKQYFENKAKEVE